MELFIWSHDLLLQESMRRERGCSLSQSELGLIFLCDMRHIFLCSKEIKNCMQSSEMGPGIKPISLSFKKIQQC